MIWLCGDTHGTTDLDKVSEYFEVLQLYQEVTKEDYLIILGDVAVCWDGGIGDIYLRDILQQLPCTVLWLDGNHENFEVIDTYPVKEWHGGDVQFIRDDIIHLMRGQVYEIEGKTFFTFGGGLSIDKYWRIPGQSWWPQEMPTEEEYELGRRNLERVDYKVDYILTHTCPTHVAPMLVEKVLPGEEELQNYLEEIYRSTECEAWYFGHWHVDWSGEIFQALWNEIVELE